MIDPSLYKTIAFLSSFTLLTPSSVYRILGLSVSCENVIIGANYQTIKLQTQYKIIKKISFTHIVIYESNPIPIYNTYEALFYYSINNTQISIPSIFYGNRSTNCLIGLR
jgi:hypothetical protein